jgi:predicted NBD/HSP70 family sugar kinase
MAVDQELNILRAIHLQSSPTRQVISQAVGLSPASLTAYLARLTRRGVVQAAGKAGSAGGRPSVTYRLSPHLGCAIGVFFETTVCQLVAVDLSGFPLAERSIPLSLPAHLIAGKIVEVIAGEVRALKADPRVSGRRILAVGVAAPGMVDTGEGVWLHGLRLSGIEHVPLRAPLEEAVAAPVLLEDEARCLAHLEAGRLGTAQASDLLLLYLGSGVGAGLVLGGELYRGHTSLAGEVGHLVVEERGDRCPCGNAGCLETVASVPAVMRRIQRRLQEGVFSSLRASGDAGDLTIERVRQAAEAGDRLALASIAEIGRAIGDACGKTIMVLNPGTLCIGGPVAALGDFLREPVWARIQEQVMPEMLGALTVRYAPYHAGDEALGAALLASRWFWTGLTPGTAAALLESAAGD